MQRATADPNQKVDINIQQTQSQQPVIQQHYDLSNQNQDINSSQNLVNARRASNILIFNSIKYTIIALVLILCNLVTLQFLWTLFWGIIFPGSLWTFGVVVGGIRSLINCRNQYDWDCRQKCNDVPFRPFGFPISFYFPLSSRVGRMLKLCFNIRQ